MRWARWAGRRRSGGRAPPGRARRQGAAAQGAGGERGCRREPGRAGLPALPRFLSGEHLRRHALPIRGSRRRWTQLAARGAALAICTNKRERLTHALLDALGWRGRFAASSRRHARRDEARSAPPPSRRSPAPAAGGPRSSAIRSPTPTPPGPRACRSSRSSFGYSDRPAAQFGADAVIDRYEELVPALERLALRPKSRADPPPQG